MLNITLRGEESEKGSVENNYRNLFLYSFDVTCGYAAHHFDTTQGFNYCPFSDNGGNSPQHPLYVQQGTYRKKDFCIAR